MKTFLQRWLVNTVAVLVATYVVPGISYDPGDWVGLLLATLVLGILNTFIRPVLLVLSLPLVIFTLGLFTIVINAILLYFVGSLFKTFHVDSFGSALLGAIVISVISMFLNLLVGTNQTKVEIRRTGRWGRRRSRPRGSQSRNDQDDGGGGGPVIDV
jgi:putative membrane protein